MSELNGQAVEPILALEREIAQDTSGDGNKGESRRSPPQAEQLLALAGNALEYCHDSEGHAYARITVSGQAGEHQETWAVRSGGFKSWLCRECYTATGKAPSVKAMQEVLGVLEARGRYDGPLREVFIRVGQTEAGNIILDLGDSRWRCVSIAPDGWKVLATSPVYFRRPKGMLALPEPVCGGNIAALRNYINVSERHWTLIVTWVIASLFPSGPYPVCGLYGEQGAAKSTAARVLRWFIDPNKAPLRGAPRNERDLVIGAANSWVLALDNLSALPDWLSDALCRIATGGGLSTRELYTNDEETLFDVMRPIILTGIEDLAGRDDLVDRSIIGHLPTIKAGQRRTEKDFWGGLEKERPFILGALLDTLAGALRHLPNVRLEHLPRMADFATRAVAACRAMGWDDEQFLTAYEDSQADAVSASLEESVLTKPLQSFLGAFGMPWEGSWQDLLNGITARAGEKAKSRNWPKDTTRLSGMLRRLAPNLRRIGIDVDTNIRTTDTKRDRRVRFTRGESSCKIASGASENRASADALDAPDAVLQSDSLHDCNDGRGDAWDGDDCSTTVVETTQSTWDDTEQ